MKPRLREKFETELVAKLKEKHNYSNVMQIPRLAKICLNQGVGAGGADKKLVDTAVEEMTTIAGQKAVPTFSKKAISNFKLREEMPIGCRVTLRGDRMYEFLDRLISVAIPRIRDFRGFSKKAFDGRGNYTLGIKEQIIFPEIDYEKIDSIRGLDISITTSAKNDDEARLLLEEFNFPFRR